MYIKTTQKVISVTAENRIQENYKGKKIDVLPLS